MRGSIRGFRGLKKKTGLIGLILFVVFVLYHLLSYFMQTPIDVTVDLEDEDPPNDDGKRHFRNWIVVTTINPPTPGLHHLSQLPGWQMVVVGDLRSPPDWSINGVVYLNMEEQKHLNYAVTKLLPYHSYARKMIGYLYAIQHGAKVIYETDDDNTISDGLKVFTKHLGDHNGQMLHVKTTNTTYNPYPHFGQPSLWPRGYPLDHIGLHQPHLYTLEPAEQITVYQGLTDSDPDVDALFRLTRTNKNVRLNLTFDTAMPPVALPVGTFAPFNSQNTLYTYDSLWALFLPTTVSQRVTDIWRSYWAQRLMWLSNQHLAFFPPGGYQIRNKHSFFDDMQEESDLYNKAGALVTFLKTWKCEEMHFFSCVSKLTKDMSLQGYLKHEDTHVLEAWLADLSSLGYAPPAMVENIKSKSKYADSSPYVHLVPNEQLTPLSHSQYAFSHHRNSLSLTAKQFAKHVCIKTSVNKSKNNIMQDKILIAIGAVSTSLLPYYEAHYRLKFTNIVYCLVNENGSVPSKISYILLPVWNEALCVKIVLRLGYNVANVMFVGPDVLVNQNSFTQDAFLGPYLYSDLTLTNDKVSRMCKIPSACNKFVISVVDKKITPLLENLPYVSNVDSVLKCVKNDLFTNRQPSDHIRHSTAIAFVVPNLHPTFLYMIEEGSSFVKDFNIIKFIIPVLFKCMNKQFSYLSMSTVDEYHAEYIIYPFDYAALRLRSQPGFKLFCNLL